MYQLKIIKAPNLNKLEEHVNKFFRDIYEESLKGETTLSLIDISYNTVEKLIGSSKGTDYICSMLFDIQKGDENEN